MIEYKYNWFKNDSKLKYIRHIHHNVAPAIHATVFNIILVIIVIIFQSVILLPLFMRPHVEKVELCEIL